MNAVEDAPLTERRTFELIHYGASRFDPKKFHPIVDRHFVKPKGGLWTSPIDCAFGWKQWCEAEEFELKRLKKSFRVRFEGEVLVIDSLGDLDKLVWVEPTQGWHVPLFEPLSFMGVDAIYLTERGQHETRFSHPRHLYGWDCESVLVLNAESLEVVQ